MGTRELSLQVREWLVVALACGVLIGLVVMTAWRGRDVFAPGIPLSISVSGAVAKPGSYSMRKQPRHKLIEGLLALAEPLPHADLNAPLSLSDDPVKGLTLQVPSHLYVDVDLSGALLSPGHYRLPKGSRICDLSRHISFLPEVDKRWLKRRRLLKEGEQLFIPKKTTAQPVLVQ